MARPNNTQERRTQIVQALAQVMAERGFERATVAEIARRAGLTPGIVHYHFHDKHEVLLCLAEELRATLQRRWELRAERASPTAWAQLETFLDAFVARDPDADPSAVRAWVALAGEAVRDEAVREVFARALKDQLGELEARVRNALREQHRSTRGTRPIAAALLAAIQGYFLLHAAAPSVTPVGSAAAHLRQMARGLVDAAAGAAA